MFIKQLSELKHLTFKKSCDLREKDTTKEWRLQEEKDEEVVTVEDFEEVDETIETTIMITEEDN